LGKGNQNQNGLGIEELEKITLFTKRSSARLPILTADRGLTMPT
jgi:hypothetical protein